MKQILVLLLIAFSSVINAKEISIVADTTEVVNENLIYKVTNDHSSVFVNISTSDRRTMMSMLRKGVTVYFDVKGKKKKDVYIKYPIQGAKPNYNRSQNQTEFQPDIKRVIKNLPQEAEYKSFDNTQQFHIGLNNLDIAISFNYNDEKGVLEYNIRIPRYRIDSGSKTDLSKLTIGVENGKTGNVGQKRAGQSGSSGTGMRGSGSRQGGRKGGSGMRGSGRKNSGSRNSSQQNRQTTMPSKDFWFKAALDI
ncbi:MAG: hypothetical protein ABFR05_12755 [Bacteroidota bacterium]